jgi:hypothetical protein
MLRYRLLARVAVGLSCLGLLLPAPLVEAGQPAVRNTPAPVDDVALDGEGRLHGLVMDVEGVPVAHASVGVFQADREVGRATSDASGRFSVGGLRGGIYRVTVGPHGRLVRAWAAHTAPPAAGDMAVVVVDRVVRGQMPLEHFFASDCFVITAMVAAMIAIPIAIHSSGGGDDIPASP